MPQELPGAAAVVQGLGKSYEARNRGSVNGPGDASVTPWQGKALTGKALGWLGGNLL